MHSSPPCSVIVKNRCFFFLRKNLPNADDFYLFRYSPGSFARHVTYINPFLPCSDLDVDNFWQAFLTHSWVWRFVNQVLQSSSKGSTIAKICMEYFVSAKSITFTITKTWNVSTFRFRGLEKSDVQTKFW